MPPTRLGHYELLGELYTESNGIIFRARHARLDRAVAVKVLPGGTAATAADIARLFREARCLAAMQHPNVLWAYDIDEAEGQQFLVLALVDGGDLQDRLATLLASPREAVSVLAPIARGLHHVHEQGFLHCDVRPVNVRFDSQGTPVLSGFACAHEYRLPPDLLGQEDYPPASPSSIGPTADVWSLGATLYCCLTGRPPLKGATDEETARLRATGVPVPPQEINPSVDGRLAAICLKCLEKEPDRRYPTAAALAQELEAWLNERLRP